MCLGRKKLIMNKSIAIPLVLICALGFLAGCSGDEGEAFTSVAVRPQTAGLRLASLGFLTADNPEQLVCDVECTKCVVEKTFMLQLGSL